ncbi:MAG TPA: polysaccharide biosynthesis/export family protein [Pyrinomonadaceae bacterium]|nr:polysaccharide biosynthesis/export family protein [Pyrinomonadaceae bacterium]
MSNKKFASGFAVKLLVVAACLAITAFSVSGQQAAGPPADKTAAVNAPVAASARTTLTTNDDDRYRIGPGDILDIRILNRPTLSRDAVRVEGNGLIRMPLIDEEIQAACKTEGELAKEIAERYTKFYRKPQVDVFIKEYHSRQVAVIGAVNEQSRFELQRRIRLLDLLTYAKGTSPKAGQTINIVHAPRLQGCQKAGDTADEAAFSSYKLSETLQGDPRANPYIEAGDIITVPEANLVYVVGNVYTPLTIPLKEPITLSRAVAMAGGVKQDSKKDKVRIVRQEPGAATSREIVVDLVAIEKKRADDIALMPNDIIDVPTSGSKTFLRGLLGTVAPSVAQLPVRIVP